MFGKLNWREDATEERRHDEEIESRDVQLLDFISKQEAGFVFRRIKELVREFKEFIDTDEDWVTTQWFGLALKRLKLIIDKRRIAKGNEVIINVGKAQERIKPFRKKIEKWKPKHLYTSIT